MSAHLELLAGIFVNMRAAENGVNVLLRREGNRAGDLSAGAGSSLDDLSGTLIQCLVVISLQTDSDLLLFGQCLFLLIARITIRTYSVPVPSMPEL